MKGIFLFLACLLLVAPLRAEIAPELREDGVLYLEGNLPGRVYGTLHAATTVYLRRDFQMALAALYSGQKIELIGAAPDGYLLKATYNNNTITGWIKPEDLPTGIDPALFTQAQKTQDRRTKVAAAIAKKTVIEGMTTDEVKQSLGNPEQVTTHTDPSGSSLVWIYTAYRDDPQYQYTLDAFGHPVLSTYYVRIPIGRTTISFVNGQVFSVTQKTTDSNSPGVVTN